MKERVSKEKNLLKINHEDENVEQTLKISDEISKNNLVENTDGDNEVKKVQNLNKFN